LWDQGHLAHPAAAASGGVKHRRAQQFGKRKGQHTLENTQLTVKNPQELSVSLASLRGTFATFAVKDFLLIQARSNPFPQRSQRKPAKDAKEG
jgi:hypothetical protein